MAHVLKNKNVTVIRKVGGEYPSHEFLIGDEVPEEFIAAVQLKGGELEDVKSVTPNKKEVAEEVVEEVAEEPKKKKLFSRKKKAESEE